MKIIQARPALLLFFCCVLGLARNATGQDEAPTEDIIHETPRSADVKAPAPEHDDTQALVDPTRAETLDPSSAEIEATNTEGATPDELKPVEDKRAFGETGSQIPAEEIKAPARLDTPPPMMSPPVADTSGPRTGRIGFVSDEQGWKLSVDGNDFMIFGMNWGYMPIGQNYNYVLWEKSDDFIRKALEAEMNHLKAMGVNTIRQYVGVPPRWIEYIYKRWGIYTVLNHSMGRYGLNLDGVWVPQTNYADSKTRAQLKQEITSLVKQYRGTPGLLMWLLGNENNYGLFWASAEIEDLPLDQQGDERAKHLYSLYGEIIDAIKAEDAEHPVAIANGDLQFIDHIAKYCPNLDVLGSNVYRGASARDLFDEVNKKLNKPFMFTEFGADAYDAKEQREDDIRQAHYLRAQWQEIYENSYGKGLAGNALGGFTFQWSDGWWKYKQESNLDVHDTTASWANDAYPEDLVEGRNNMNEEWFGIAAKGPTRLDGSYEVYPRTAYYVLQAGYRLAPYEPTTDLDTIRKHWGAIRPEDFGSIYRTEQMVQKSRELEMLRLSNVVLDLRAITTGGESLTDPDREQSRIDHLESFYAGVTMRPSADLEAEAVVNVLGGVPENPINEIFFENRALPQNVIDENGDELILRSLERVKLYRAKLEWRTPWVDVEAFYRAGHYHWGYEGDFFGLYPEAYYQQTADTFNADMPFGAVFTGRQAIDGLKVAFGPELWWGANPTVIAKYFRQSGAFEYSLMHQEDVAQRSGASTSSVIAVPRTRKTSAYLGWKQEGFKLQAGVLMAGTDRLGWSFSTATPATSGKGYLNSGYDIVDSEIQLLDTFGAKAKLSFDVGPVHAYLQGAWKGLVADGGPDATITYTGWSLKESGQGNHYHVLGGATLLVGDFQIAPNFLYQKPIAGPLPAIADYFDSNTGNYFPGVRPRNQLMDPFWVRSNRETIGFELLLAYDPTPATWMWSWDNVFQENAAFAAFLDFVYRHQPTSQDAGVGVAAEGWVFAFDGGAPATDLWELRGRIISAPTDTFRLVATAYAGEAQSTGSDTRKITRLGADARLIWHQWNLEAFARINDWGPYDYHRDFNLTFPLQTMGDVSYALGSPAWFVQAYTRMGIRGTLRLLDAFSPRFEIDENNDDHLGNEWEIQTYITVQL